MPKRTAKKEKKDDEIREKDIQLLMKYLKADKENLAKAEADLSKLSPIS